MLSAKNASQILRGVHFPGQERVAQNEKIAASTKDVRRKLIILPVQTEEGRVAAAVEIQRIWRGFFTRLRLASILEGKVIGKKKHVIYPQSNYQTEKDHGQPTPVQPFSHQVQPPSHRVQPRSHQVQPQPIESPAGYPVIRAQQQIQHKATLPTDSSAKTATPKQQFLHQRYEEYLQTAATYDTSNGISYEEYCAHYIQNWWFKVRRRPGTVHGTEGPAQQSRLSAHIPGKSISLIVTSNGAPITTTAAVEVKRKREGPIEAREAAVMIQRAWRRHIDIQVYRYYRDLINFRCCGNPALMLRCINPRESELLDPAAGIHIKFRLAGVKFPPNIYYKIFTHRNIVDMCANSPKDYTAASVKRRDAKDVHNRRKGSGRGNNKVGWYQRIENNGWRLVSDRLILQADQDPVTSESSKKPQEFHHSKLRRKADVERKKRRRKLEWMQKMYKEGRMEGGGSEPAGDGSMVGGAAEGMLAVMDERGPDAIQDWEVDELLQWTDGLNFDDYLTDWQVIATSASSEKISGDHLKFDTMQVDPFEFSLAMDTPSNTSPYPSTGKRAPMPTPLKCDVIIP